MASFTILKGYQKHLTGIYTVDCAVEYFWFQEFWFWVLLMLLLILGFFYFILIDLQEDEQSLSVM